MPSPFPGMDPWLEASAVWPDFHDALAGEIRATLNCILPEPYYAQLGAREELGIVGHAAGGRIIPDVTVNTSAKMPRQTTPSTTGGTAVLDSPRSEVTESLQWDFANELQSVSFIEIRDARSGHDVVTVIEILSPSNKSSGPDHDSYLRKRTQVLASTTSLIEIDLLRAGRRDFFGAEVHQRMYEFDPQSDYIVFVQRAWQRSGRLLYQLFPICLIDTLPVIAVPLRQADAEATLDLQYAFQQTYERGPYRRGAVNYDQPPQPPLSDTLAVWAQQQLDVWRQAN